jgi:hypothetical protein
MASDGDCQPCILGHRSQIYAANPQVTRFNAHQSQALTAAQALTVAERLQYQGYPRREQTNPVIIPFAKDGATIKQIVRRTA